MNQHPLPFENIMAVTNRSLARRPFMEQIETICRLHPAGLILREKDLGESDYLELARQVLSICQKHGVLFIPHFYPEAAKALQVQAVHLPLPKLEDLSTKDKSFFTTIGVSVHSVEEALRAEKAGATYLTAGHIFATDCKKGLPPRGLHFLEEVCKSVSLPVWAIGGIRPDAAQIETVCRHQAAGACIMSGMMRL